MYTRHNYRTKKALREDFEAGKRIEVWQPLPFGPVKDGKAVIEGPHHPEPHRWYAAVTVRDGVIVAMKGAKTPLALAPPVRPIDTNIPGMTVGDVPSHKHRS